MTTGEFLVQLRSLDVDLWLDGDRVRCSAPAGALTDELRAELGRRRTEIEAALRAAAAAVSPAIVPIQTGGTHLPFYGVPGHNGDVFCFVPLARHLGRDYPFYGLQPPGLSVDTPPFTRVEELAELFVNEIVRRDPGPYQIGGYCLGGVTAYEMARRLRAMGRDVRLLVMFGTMSPAAMRPLNRAQAEAAYWIGNRLAGARSFMALPAPERARRLGEKLRHLVAPARVSNATDADPIVQRRLRLEAATLEAAYRYRPEPYPGRITFFAANEAATHTLDRPLEWGAHARGGLDVCCGPADCNGDSMLRDPSAAWFARQLASRLTVSRHESAAVPEEAHHG